MEKKGYKKVDATKGVHYIGYINIETVVLASIKV
jgi:hypothetical protein